MGKPFNWPVRIYYEDTDSGGVVYYANYLKFMERARTEWLRSHGFEQDVLRDEFGVLFVVRSVALNYLKPALFNDLLNVQTSILKSGKASIEVQHQIFRDDVLLCEGIVKVASVAHQGFKPTPFPPRVRDVLEN